MDTVTKEILSVLKNQQGFSDQLETFTGLTASSVSEVAKSVFGLRASQPGSLTPYSFAGSVSAGDNLMIAAPGVGLRLAIHKLQGGVLNSGVDGSSIVFAGATGSSLGSQRFIYLPNPASSNFKNSDGQSVNNLNIDINPPWALAENKPFVLVGSGTINAAAIITAMVSIQSITNP